MAKKSTELDKFIDAASRHGEEFGEPDHEVGDLQDALRIAYKVMNAKQRLVFIAKCRAEISAFENA